MSFLNELGQSPRKDADRLCLVTFHLALIIQHEEHHQKEQFHTDVAALLWLCYESINRYIMSLTGEAD